MTKSIFPVGATVESIVEHPGVMHNGVTYGYLPKEAVGKVTGHTDDGRAVVHFSGYDVHTFALDIERERLRRVLTDEEKLKALASFACDILSQCGLLAGSDIRSYAIEHGLIHDDPELLDASIIVTLKDWIVDLLDEDHWRDSIANAVIHLYGSKL